MIHQPRSVSFGSLALRPPELLIIGGGIVGVSTAAHAARMGLDVLLVEKEDFAFGASGHSTGLAHAGLRYLAQGRIFYVFHESRERRRLQHMAPHWVKPFNFLYPVYQGDAFPLWVVRLGTWIYDRMAWLDATWAKVPPPRRFTTVEPKPLLVRVPELADQGLAGATEYFVDAQVSDHQLTLAFAQDAAVHGARLLTHTAVERIQRPESSAPEVVVTDLLTDRTYSIRPKLILNCTGADIDAVRHTAGFTTPLVSRSRGTHLVIERIAEDPLIFSSQEKGRVFFVLPGPSQTSIVGTTDVPENSADESHPQETEIRLLLDSLKKFFPHVQPHIRSLYWGVRPLYRQRGPTRDASREHRLIKETSSFWSFPGVKLTAGRVAGEQAARAAFIQLRGKKAERVDLGILPGADREARLHQWLLTHPEERQRVVPEEKWEAGEGGFSAAEEMAFTLNDFLWRRAKWPLYRDIPDASLRNITRSMARVLDWNENDMHRQMQDYYRVLKDHRL